MPVPSLPELYNRGLSFLGLAKPLQPKVQAPAPDARPNSDLVRWARAIVERLREETLRGRFVWPRWVNASQDEAAADAAYAEMMDDALVFAGVCHLVDATAALDLQVIAHDPGDEAEKDAAKFCRECVHCVRGGRLELVRATLVPALTQRWSVSEKVWRVVPEGDYEGKWGWAAWKSKDVNKLDPVVDDKLNVLGVISSLDPGVVFPPDDLVIHHNFRVYENPRGRAQLQSAYKDWFEYVLANRFWGVHIEKWGSPFLVGNYTEASKREELERQLAAVEGNSWMAAPAGTTVEAIMAATSGAETFSLFTAAKEKRVLIAILGSHLPVLEGNNKNAPGNSETQRGTTDVRLWALSEQMARVFTEQFDQLVRVNFPGVRPPYAKLGAVSEAEVKLLVENDAAVNKLVPLSKSSVYERTGRQPPTGPDDEIPAGGGGPQVPVGPPPGAPPGASPPAGGGRQPPPIPGQRTPARRTPPPPPSPPPRRKAPARNYSTRKTSTRRRYAEEGREAALAGKDGAAVEGLLAESERKGAAFAAALFSDAASRLSPRELLASERLLGEMQEAALTDLIAATNGTAELLGRFFTRRLFRFPRRPASEGLAAEVPALMAPEKAVRYFRRLEPGLSVTDAWAAGVERDAFRLAVTTDRVVLGRVKGVILEAIAEGREAQVSGPRLVREALKSAGVAPRHRQYAEMVFRTNLMDSYNAGNDAERREPDVAPAFPAWRYLGIRDGREGDDHRPQFGRYYPNHVGFASVRGPRPFNCRCTSRPVYVSDWERLLEKGVTFSPVPAWPALPGLARYSYS